MVQLHANEDLIESRKRLDSYFHLGFRSTVLFLATMAKICRRLLSNGAEPTVVSAIPGDLVT